MTDERHLARRLAATTVDSLLANAVQLLGFVPAVLVATGLDMDHDPTAPLYAVLASVIGLGLGLGSVVAFVLRDRWRSPGKRWMGLDVVDIGTGARCSLKQAAIRNGIYIALGIVDALVPVFRADGRRLGDLAAGTRVVRVR